MNTNGLVGAGGILFICAILGCGSAQPTTDQPIEVNLSASAQPPLPLAGASGATAPPPAPLPAFLDVDSSAKDLSKLVALWETPAPIYEDAGGAEISEGPPEPADLDALTVIEQTSVGGHARVRVVVVGSFARLGVWVDEADLALVTLAGARMLPHDPFPAKEDDQTCEVRFRPGVPLVQQGKSPLRPDQFLRAAFTDGIIVAQGSVEISHLGRVFVPADIEPLPQGKPVLFTAGVTFYDAPSGGDQVGVIGYQEGDPTYAAVTLGKVSGGRSLVAATTEKARVTGWVESKSLKPTIPTEYGLLGLGGLGTTRIPRNPLQLHKGIVLLGPAHGEPIGIMLDDLLVECEARCSSKLPVVSIHSMFGMLKVVADLRSTKPQ